MKNNSSPNFYISPIIVIPVFKRVDSLTRLLKSLQNSDYNTEVNIIFSAEYDASDKVINLLKKFDWKFGNKKIIRHNKHLGVDANNLFCMGLAIKYGSVVILEDDTLVMPNFYNFAVDILKFYTKDKNLAGFSLYKYQNNEENGLPFYPIDDDSDVFFLQKASTRGEIFTKEQIEEFFKWKNNQSVFNDDLLLPERIKSWANDNWEKQFNFYLVAKNKYFLYPRLSYSTIFGEIGVHVKKKKYFNTFQSVLQWQKSTLKLKEFSISDAKYDPFHELKPEVLQKFNKNLSGYDFEVDLYSNKDLSLVKKKYILSLKKSVEPVFTYSLSLKPHELNVIMNMKGNDITLGLIKNFKNDMKVKRKQQLYFFFPQSIKSVLRNIIKDFFYFLFEIKNSFISLNYVF